MYNGLSFFSQWVRETLDQSPQYAMAYASQYSEHESHKSQEKRNHKNQSVNYFLHWNRTSVFSSKTPFYGSTFSRSSNNDNIVKVDIVAKPLKSFLTGLLILFVVFLLSRPGRNEGFTDKEVIVNEDCSTTFDDIIGNEEAKEDLSDIIHYLKNPEKMQELGVKIPKGVLLVGPPGTGKTLLARAVSGEAKVPFIVTSGSEFEEMYVGVGARRVRKLFSTAKEHAPCIVFIDEIDAVGGKRDENMNRTHMTLNQLLVEMDGFVGSEKIIVMAATNFEESLDPALVRSGRFDRKVYTDLPNSRERKQLLDFYLKGKPTSFVNTGSLSLAIPGFSGSDIQTMVNWAHMQAVKEDNKIKMGHLEDAIMNVSMGRERKSLQMSEFTKRLCAYHEGGHALVSLHTPGSLEIGRATLIPRGGALGMVNYLDKDDPLRSYQELLASMDTAMGGRVAEEIIFGKENITQGASSDFQKATQIATSMVTKLGMSSLGPIYISDKGRLSPETQRSIDLEIQRLLSESYERSKRLLKENEKQLHMLANALIKYEVLTLEEIKTVLLGQSLTERDREIQDLLKAKEERLSSTIVISEKSSLSMPQTNAI